MPDFNVGSESVDVEQVMEQIRARIREKRGVDYTEQQLRELAAVKLERFLDPRGVRSDLLQRFKERQPQYEKPVQPVYVFEDTTIYETHRGLLRWIRGLLNPVLKLLFNPQPIIHALHAQVEINTLNLDREAAQEKRRMEMETLYYEIIHNLVFELTRTGIEVKNLKMRVESLVSRLEFNERRSRALESVVVYQRSSDEPGGERATPPPGATRPRGGAPANHPQPAAVDAGVTSATPAGPEVPNLGAQAEGPGQRSRRRRRRRGRRSGSAGLPPEASPPSDPAAEPDAGSHPNDPPELAAAALPADSPAEPARHPSTDPGGSDPDQRGSDPDQRGSDPDQRGSDPDQRGSDPDHGSDPDQQ
jgi:hypothetical protein